MREYIKRTYHAALMTLRRGSGADFDRLDAIIDHNAEVASRAYSAVLAGHYAYIRNGKQLIVFTRSLYDCPVQASYFHDHNGDMEPVMHEDIHNVKEMERALLPGARITIKEVC